MEQRRGYGFDERSEATRNLVSLTWAVIEF